MDLTIEIAVSRSLQSTFRGSRIVARELVKATEWGVNRFRQEVDPLTPSGATSTLRGANMTSIRGESAGELLVGRVWNAQGYARPVEEGGRAHRAPFDKILYWAKRVIGGRNYRTAARAIWHSISVRGTKPRRFYLRAWNATKPPIEARFEKALAEAARKIGTE